MFFSWSTGSPVIDVPKPVNIFSKKIKQFLYEKIHFRVVFQKKIFGINYFDMWHLKGCQITLFRYRLTTENVYVRYYISGSFFKRKFLALFILIYDTSKGVKLHFLGIGWQQKMFMWDITFWGSFSRENCWQLLFWHVTPRRVSNYTLRISWNT